MNPHIPTQLDGSTVPFYKMPASAADEGDRTLSHGVPARPLLGTLPLARLIPQDVHSIMDYVNGLTTGSGALLGRNDPAAFAASMILAGSVIGVSAISDYRLSLVKILPIEAHEVIDYAWGAMAIAAPFVLGYWKSSPLVAAMHVASGVGTILSSLFTDYRSATAR